MEDLKIALFCDEYMKQARIFRNNPGPDAARVSSNAMTVNRRAIEGEVDDALRINRFPELGDVAVATRTLAFFGAWLARRGGWE
jgi:hypothetical protein